MCLFSSRRPAWEEDVVFANRPSKRHSRVVSETVVRKRTSPPPAQYIQAPRSSTPIIRAATPQRIVRASSVRALTPPAPRVELVEVEESRRSPRGSRTSVSNATSRRSRKASRAGEEVYIERERVIDRLPEREPEPVGGYRYVEGPPRASERHVEAEALTRSRSRSITYETNPRISARTLERERVVVEDDGRRREYYRRP